MRISDDELISELHRVADEYGQPPKAADMKEYGEYAYSTYYRRFGSWEEALAAAGFEPPEKQSNVRLSDEALLAEIHRLAEEYSEPPTLQELREHGNHSNSTYRERFGSWQEALAEAGYTPRQPQSEIPEEKLLAELRRLANKYDDIPSSDRMNEKGEYWASTYRRRFGSWNEALTAAGLDTRENSEISREELISELNRVAEKTAGAPSFREIEEMATYGVKTYVRRFGSFNEALVAAGFEPRSPPGEIPKADLIAELQRLDENIEGRVTSLVMDEKGEYATATYQRRFGSWTEALEAAGVI